MQIYLNKVPASHGLLWVKFGLRAFLKNPWLYINLFLLYFFSVFLLSSIPFVGTFFAFGLVPFLILAFTIANRMIENTQSFIHVGHIIKNIYTPTNNHLTNQFVRRQLLQLAMLQGGLTTLGVNIIASFYQKQITAFLTQLQSTASLSSITEETLISISTFMLLASFGQAFINLLFLHAPILIHSKKMGFIKAVFFSILAIKNNIFAVFYYIVLWMLIYMSVFAFEMAFSSAKMIIPFLTIAAGIFLGCWGLCSTFYCTAASFKIKTPTEEPV